MSYWLDKALKALEKSLNPIPQEINELDWKSNLSDKSDRVAQHISAFANLKGGGFLVFGINNDASFVGLEKDNIDDIVNRVGNIARNNLAQPVGVDHCVYEYNGHVILFVFIPEANDKPVHLRGQDYFESYKRSAGQTVKLTREEVKQLISISFGYGFEKQIAETNISADEVLNQIDYDSYFRLSGTKLPDTKTHILEKLESEDLIKKNFDSWDITNLGGVPFWERSSVFQRVKKKSCKSYRL